MNSVTIDSTITTMKEFRSASDEEKRNFLAPLFTKLSDRQIAELLGSSKKKDINYIGLTRRKLGGLDKGRGWNFRQINQERYAKTSQHAQHPLHTQKNQEPDFEVRLAGSFSKDTLAEQLDALRLVIERMNRENSFKVNIAVEGAKNGAAAIESR